MNSKVESHKKFGFDFIGKVSVDLIESDFAYITKHVEVFDCNGVLVGSVTQEVTEDYTKEPNAIYEILSTTLNGGVGKQLAFELLGSEVYSLNEYVHI